MTDTVTVRLPKSVHQKAKIAASQAGMSLQDWISSAATRVMVEGGAEPEPTFEFASTYRLLPPNHKRCVGDFIELLVIGSRDHVKNLEQHITALVRILRRCDPKFLREFEQL